MLRWGPLSFSGHQISAWQAGRFFEEARHLLGFLPGVSQKSVPCFTVWKVLFSEDLFREDFKHLQYYQCSTIALPYAALSFYIPAISVVGKVILKHPKQNFSMAPSCLCPCARSRSGYRRGFCLIPFTPCHKWSSVLWIPVSSRNLRSQLTVSSRFPISHG